MQKIAIRLRIKPPKRRTPLQRLKARLYYRKNRARIRMQRRRYLRLHRAQIKHRKMFMRYKPTWFKKPKKPRHYVKPRKVRVSVPKIIKHPKPRPVVIRPYKPVKIHKLIRPHRVKF